MPDKEGSDDEKKSTKSVVNKKQKQMMGEEGYDIARDMGKVKPSKDKKDATTMPVSDEVKKTQKKSKGKSAVELVKARYGKSVMNVGKKKANEELDLSKVAEAFGGYIVEAPAKKSSYAYSRELGPKGRYQTKNIVKRALKAFPPEGQKLGDSDDAEIEKQILSARMDKGAMQQAGKDQIDDLSSAKSPRGTPAKRIKGASGGKKTGSLRKGNLEFPGDRTGATQQTKADIEARKGFAGASTVDKKGKKKKISGLKDDETNKYVDRDFRQDRATEPDPAFTPTVDPKKIFPFGKKPVTGGLPMGEPTLPSKNQKTFPQFDKERSDLKQAIRNIRTSKERMGQVSQVQQRKKAKQDAQSSFNRQQRQSQTDYMGGDFGMGQPGDGEPQSSKVSRQKVTDIKTGKETEKIVPEKGGPVVVYRQRKGEDLVKDLKKKKSPVINPDIMPQGGNDTSALRTVNSTRLQNIKATGAEAAKKYAQFASKNPALGLATYDLGKGIIGKIMKTRMPAVQGGRAIQVSARQ